MPFSSVSDLPSNIKKLPAKKQRQWMAVFNSAFSAATKEGKSTKDAEGSAFAQANGVVKKDAGGLAKLKHPRDSNSIGASAHGDTETGGSGKKGKRKKRPKTAKRTKGVPYKMSTVENFINTAKELIQGRPRVNKYDLLEKGVSEETIAKIGVYDDEGNLRPHDREETNTFESESTTFTRYREDGTQIDEETSTHSTFTSNVIIKSVDQREWIVYGVVMEPTAEGELSKDGESFVGKVATTDFHNHFTTAPEIRKAMIGFMEVLHRTKAEPHNIQHKSGIIPRTAIIENYQAMSDFDLGGEVVVKGSWVMGVKVYDNSLRKAIEKGEITGFSIEGHGILSPVSQR